jgi:hypothetical protein
MWKWFIFSPVLPPEDYRNAGKVLQYGRARISCAERAALEPENIFYYV